MRGHDDESRKKYDIKGESECLHHESTRMCIGNARKKLPGDDGCTLSLPKLLWCPGPCCVRKHP
eukprot:1331828-Amorphochlora_amoeboformis.AAC.1